METVENIICIQYWIFIWYAQKTVSFLSELWIVCLEMCISHATNPKKKCWYKFFVLYKNYEMKFFFKQHNPSEIELDRRIQMNIHA